MDTRNLSLLADLHKFTMAVSYFQHRMHVPATFSLFIRAYPPKRGYFVNAGLEEVLDFVGAHYFEPQGIRHLDSSPKPLEDRSLFPVGLGPGLEKLQRETAHQIRERELGES